MFSSFGLMQTDKEVSVISLNTFIWIIVYFMLKDDISSNDNDKNKKLFGMC